MNNLLDERFVRRAFDHLHQLQRGLLQLDALRRRFVERPVNYMRPVNQVAQGLSVETKFCLRNIGDEFSAGLAAGIEKLPAGLVRPEVSFILRREKGRLM